MGNEWTPVTGQNEAAQVKAAMSALEGLLKSNPHEVTAPPTVDNMVVKANDVVSCLNALKAVVDANIGALAPADQQSVLNAYGELLIQEADLKQMASNRFLTQVAQLLGTSYEQHTGAIFVWGNTYHLSIPRTPAL